MPRGAGHQQDDERELIGKGAWTADGLVFKTEDGTALHRSTISKQFARYLKQTGPGHFRLHDLRHTYGSLLMSQGVPLKTISELMGRASIDVTADIYLHCLDTQADDTALMVEKALAAPAKHAEGTCPTCGQALRQ